MAAAAPSPLASSVEKTNGAKLSRLLIDGGTTVLRNVFDGFHPPANLAANLNANRRLLNNLVKKKVLHQPQWDLLFPPSGATPDSNTFDITLLFLLLINICGLSPPPSGWHKPPPSSDTSREANLARIKLYRNKLYGHVTSTGVKTAEFNIKWQEISAVLVALGLNAAEVARLKAAPCGEDYISTVIEWVKSDEELASQLVEVLKRQEEDHKTLEETHKAVEDVRQIHQDTHQVVKEMWTTHQEVHQKQQGDHRTLQDTHQAVEDVREIHQGTYHVIKDIWTAQQEGQKKQEEDHRTLQDTHKIVGDIHRIHQDTHQVVEEIWTTQQKAHQKQDEDRRTLQDTHQAVEDVRQIHQVVREIRTTQHEAKGAINKVVKTQEKNRETLQQVKEKVQKMEGSSDEDKHNKILRKLAEVNSQKVINDHAERYQEGTRVFFFQSVEKWLDDRSSPNRVMLISGNAGMGKSVIAAVICKRMQEAGRLSGSHFCQHDKARYRNPKVMLQSLACQLSSSLPEYKDALVKTLSRNLGVKLNNMEVKDLFDLLFDEVLSKLDDPGRNILLVVDGLDESEYQGRNELLDVISNHFIKLPHWHSISSYDSTRNKHCRQS